MTKNITQEEHDFVDQLFADLVGRWYINVLKLKKSEDFVDIAIKNLREYSKTNNPIVENNGKSLYEKIRDWKSNSVCLVKSVWELKERLSKLPDDSIIHYSLWDKSCQVVVAPLKDKVIHVIDIYSLALMKRYTNTN